MKFGALIQVFSEDKGKWIHRYFSHFDESGKVCVFAHGCSPYTARTMHGDQICHLDPDEMSSFFEYENLYHFEKYEQHRSDFVAELKTGLAPARGFVKEELMRGTLIQVKYEENERWHYAHLDRIWDDGRVQVIAFGRTPFTEEDHEGNQRHESEHGHVEHMWAHNTNNFWRHKDEVTDSGDLRLTDQHKAFWGEGVEHKKREVV